MKRVIVYIDGFNLYHALDDLADPSLKWVDLYVLSQSLLRKGEELVAVKYFSAYATWREESYRRHREYVKALKAVGVQTVMGKFKEKPRHCHVCKAKWMSHEEKETDVHIALQMVIDAFMDDYDRAILISADSDLAPAIRKVKQHQPNKEVFVVAPPERYGFARDLNPKLALTKGKIRKCLFSEKVMNAQGGVAAVRPDKYRPIDGGVL